MHQSNLDYDFNHTTHSDIPELKKNKKHEVINFNSMNKDMDILDMTIQSKLGNGRSPEQNYQNNVSKQHINMIEQSVKKQTS